MESIGMFQDASEAECWKVTGAAPVTTRWVMVGKTLDDGEKIVRCRLVGRDFKGRDQGVHEDLFAATPPLEALKLLLRLAAVRKKGQDVIKLMFLDVRKAHLIPPCHDDVYVRLPEEFGKDKVVKLKRWLYGMRRAANSWEAYYAAKLREIGFQAGVASPVLFHNGKTGVRLVVHGDDFVFAGTHSELVEVRRWMKGWCDIKDHGILGPDDKDVKEREILGRTVRWCRDSLEYYADGKHREIIMQEFGLSRDSKSVGSPMVKEAEGGEDEEELEMQEASRVRGLIARANYLAQDRMDLQFTTKELSRWMSRPRKGEVVKLKRLARYLVGAEKVIWRFPFTEEECRSIDVYADSNWAACLESRRSTSGG